MVIPLQPRRQVIINHDTWTAREGDAAGATPEALAGIFPFGYRPTAAIEKATLSFHLDRVEPYIGYPMLSAPLGVYAAMLGDRQRSAELFEAGYAEFITDPYREANEFSNKRFPEKPRVGPLFANVGGFLTSVLYGLPRLRLSSRVPEDWPDGSVTMPDGWDGIEVDRIWVRGRPTRLRAIHGEGRATLASAD
jgi:protein-glucosylgalactosylhydroxylysine glucosidase